MADDGGRTAGEHAAAGETATAAAAAVPAAARPGVVPEGPVVRRTASGWSVGDEDMPDLTCAMVLADLIAAELPDPVPEPPGRSGATLAPATGGGTATGGAGSGAAGAGAAAGEAARNYLAVTGAPMRRGGSGQRSVSWNEPSRSGSGSSRRSEYWPSGTESGRGRLSSSSDPSRAGEASGSSISLPTSWPARPTRCCHFRRNSPGPAWRSASGDGASAVPGVVHLGTAPSA